MYYSIHACIGLKRVVDAGHTQPGGAWVEGQRVSFVQLIKSGAETKTVLKRLHPGSGETTVLFSLCFGYPITFY